MAVAFDAQGANNLLSDLGGDRDALAELAKAIHDEAPQLLAQLDDALKAGNAADARRAAHTLKGTCATFGMTLVHQRALEAQKMAEAGDLAALAQAVPGLREAVDQGLAGFDAWMAGL